jgi:flagellar P-ring protein precursor FlgI
MHMKGFVFIFVFLFGCACSTVQEALAARIKDIASFSTGQTGQLVGYGLITGLNRTGDNRRNPYTVRTIYNLLRNNGIKVEDIQRFRGDDTAAVMVTATVPPYARAGNRFDVVVSAMGDARSLVGGTLIMTPLSSSDGKLHAIAQGPLSVGGFGAFGALGAAVVQNHLTAGRIPNGAMLQNPPNETSSGPLVEVGLTLQTPDFTTAMRMASVINKSITGYPAKALDAGYVRIQIPEKYQNDPAYFMAALENLDVRPDAPAKVVIDERTGTVVMGGNVTLSPVAVSHGNLTVTVQQEVAVVQPPPFTQAGPVVVPQEQLQVQEQQRKVAVVDGSATIQDVVRGLNALGASPRDLIAILQAIKQVGALHADLEIL